MVVIYDKKTGKPIEVKHSIDAKEWLATGKYVDKKPVRRTAQPTEEK